MKTLLILRHAKSSWKYKDRTDHDRPLNDRGRKAAPRMGRLLRDQGLVPDLIVSSTAVRALTTARLAAEACGYDGETVDSPDLYLADPLTWIEALAELDDEVSSVLIVGHNPGHQQLVRLFSGRDEPFQTAALAAIRLPIDRWSALTPRTRGDLVGLWRPRELEGR